MKIAPSEFKEILLKIKPGLASKGIVEQATHFVFTGDDVFTYNDQISISYPLETEFKCSVPSTKLYDFVKDLKGKEVEVTLKEGQLLLTCGKTKAGINVSTDETIMELVDDMGFPKDTEWKSLDKEFLEGIKLCMFSASKDLSCPYMTCISVENNRLVSGDDIRISLFDLKHDISDTFLLPATAATELVKFDIVEYALMKSWVFFSTLDGIVFCSRIVVDEYPNVSEFFEMNNAVTMKLPSEFKDSINTVYPMADGDFDIDKQIEISVTKNTLKCRSDGASGWAETSIDIHDKVPDLTFKANPVFLSEVLEHNTTMTYEPGKLLILSGKLKHLMSLVV